MRRRGRCCGNGHPDYSPVHRSGGRNLQKVVASGGSRVTLSIQPLQLRPSHLGYTPQRDALQAQCPALTLPSRRSIPQGRHKAFRQPPIGKCRPPNRASARAGLVGRPTGTRDVISVPPTRPYYWFGHGQYCGSAHRARAEGAGECSVGHGVGRRHIERSGESRIAYEEYSSLSTAFLS